MKKLLNYLVVVGVLCLPLFMFSCDSQDEGMLTDEQVTFSIQLDGLQPGGRGEEVLQANVSAIILSIKRPDNTSVFVNKRISLFAFGNAFVSEPLPMKPGRYLLHEFWVVDANNNVLFATPVEGSEMAYLVTDPIEIAINVVRNGVNKVTPEVLATRGFTSANFGYATFSFFETTTFDFDMAVMIYNGGTSNFELTPAVVKIQDSEKNITYISSTTASTTSIRLPDIYSSYTICVHKAGYQKFEKVYTMEELRGYSDEVEPLIILLQPGNLVFWNKLGSDQEVLNSEIGPNLYFYTTTSGGVHVAANHEYVVGKFGNAITIAPGTYYSTSRVHNVVLENPSTVISSEKGTIECYYFQNKAPVAYDHNPHRIVDGPYGFLSGMGFVSQDYYENGTKNALTFYFALGGTPVSVSVMDFDVFNNQWIHLAAVWDRRGIETTDETMQLYINGVKVGHTTENNWGTQFGNLIDIAGGNDANIANQFYVDELKFYDYAKTTF